MPTFYLRAVYRKAFTARFTTRRGITHMVLITASTVVVTTTRYLGRIAILSRKWKLPFVPSQFIYSYRINLFALSLPNLN